MDKVHESIRKARYNDAVILSVEAQEYVLVATLDQDNGGVAWLDAKRDATDSDKDVALLRHLRTKTWVLPMLNDDCRNDTYSRAIQQACQAALEEKKKKNETPILQCLDIGSGTGLLAMMTAKHAASLGGRVNLTLVEMASCMARLARRTLAANGFDNNKSIVVVEGHSCEESFRVKPEADLCTSELLESGFLGEGVLPALRDAWKRHLSPHAIMVPRGARVYGQVLEGKDRILAYTTMTGPSSCSNVRLRTSASAVDSLCPGGFLVPIHAETLFRESDLLKDAAAATTTSRPCRILSDPVLLFEYDFSSLQAMPPSSGVCKSLSVVPTASGVAHGILLWWELDLWHDIIYSTRESGDGTDHWRQALYVLEPHSSATKWPELECGSTFSLEAAHDDFSFSFRIAAQQEAPGGQAKRQRLDDKSSLSSSVQPKSTLTRTTAEDEEEEEEEAVERPSPLLPIAKTSPSISPHRALELNDARRWNIFQEGILAALAVQKDAPSILDLSDFGLVGLIAAVDAKAPRVTSVESSAGDVPRVAAQVAQMGNGLGDDSSGSKFVVLNCHLEQLQASHLIDQVPANIVVGEPYYETLEGWSLLEALNYHNSLQALLKRGVIAANAVSVPCFACVMVVAIESHALAKSYRRLERREPPHQVAGFDHELVHRYTCTTYDMKLCLEEYAHECLSAPVQVAKLSYEDEGTCHSHSGEWVSMPILRNGTVDALVLWVDHGVRVNSSTMTTTEAGGRDEFSFKTLSTLSRHCCQMVRMLPVPQPLISKEQHLQVKLSLQREGTSSLEPYHLEWKMDQSSL